MAKKSKRNEAANKQAKSCDNCGCGHGKAQAQNRKGGEFSDLKVPSNEQQRQDCR